MAAIQTKNIKKFLAMFLAFVMLFALMPITAPKAYAYTDYSEPSDFYNTFHRGDGYVAWEEYLEDPSDEYTFMTWDQPNIVANPSNLVWMNQWPDHNNYEEGYCFMKKYPYFRINTTNYPEEAPDGVTLYYIDPYSHISVSSMIAYSKEEPVQESPDDSNLKKMALNLLPLIGPDGWHGGSSAAQLGMGDDTAWRYAVECVVVGVAQNIIKIDPVSGYTYIPEQTCGPMWSLSDAMSGTPYSDYHYSRHGYVDRIRTNSSTINAGIVQVLCMLDMFLHIHCTGAVQYDTRTSAGWTLKEKLAALGGISAEMVGTIAVSDTIAAEMGLDTSGTSVKDGNDNKATSLDIPWGAGGGYHPVVEIDAISGAAPSVSGTKAASMWGSDGSWGNLSHPVVIFRTEPAEIIRIVNGYIHVHKSTEDQAYNASLSGHTFVVVDASTGAEVARADTDANGYYEFTLSPGTYNVYEIRKEKYSVSGDTWRQNGIVVEPSQVTDIYPTNTLVRGGVQWRKFDYDFNS
jgi:hypothetical protein